MAQPDEENDAEHAFGKAVRDVRRTRGWTQDQLRRRLLDGHGIELSKTAMARLELGQRPIRLNEVHALALLLGIDLSGFGRDPTTEKVHGVARVVQQHLDAADREMTLVSDELARMDMQRAHWEKKLIELREISTAARRVVTLLMNGNQDEGWAIEELNQLLANTTARELLAGDDSPPDAGPELRHLRIPAPKRKQVQADGDR